MATNEGQSLEVVRKSYPEQIATLRAASKPLRNDEPRTAHLREYLNVIFARRASFAGVLLTVLAIGVMSVYKQTPIYLATATLEIDRENSRILTFDEVSPRQQDDALQTQFKILESESLARKVVTDLGLDKETAPAVQPAPRSFLSGIKQSVARLFSSQSAEDTPAKATTDLEDPARPYVDNYLGGLLVTPITRTRLVNVGYESTDPRLAAKIANAHAEHFIEQNLQFKWEAIQIASEFLKKELATLRSNLEKAEDNLQAYSLDHEIFVVDEGDNAGARNTETERLSDLQVAYTKAQTERIEKESSARLAKELAGNVSESGPLVEGSLHSQLIELRRQDASMDARFLPGFGPRKEIQNQIQAISKAIETEETDRIKRAEDEYAAALDREQAFERELRNQGEKVNRMKQKNVQYGILKREADSNRQLYDALLLRLKEAGISSSLKASNIRIIDRAKVPTSPVRPHTRRGVLNALVLALALSLGFVFFQEYMDSSVKSPDDVTKYFKLPTLGLIPRFQKGGMGEQRVSGNPKVHRPKKNGTSQTEHAEPLPIELISHSAPASLVAEAYRSLRASLILSTPDHPPHIILVTSAVPSEGKTTTAANIAISLTQTRACVLLVDADMRRPCIDSIFNLRKTPGLSNFLTGTEQLESVIHETAVTDLFVIPCGVIPPNPGELILSRRFRDMLESLRLKFDYIVIDSPPLSNVSDARIIAAEAEGVVLVVRALSTSRHMVLRSLEQLEQTKTRVVGAVLNDYDIHNKGNYYYPYNRQSDYKQALPPDAEPATVVVAEQPGNGKKKPDAKRADSSGRR